MTKIANGFGQFDYSLETLDEVLLEGQLHSRGQGVRAFNPANPQTTTATFSGADNVAGEYKLTITNKVTNDVKEFAATNTGAETLQATVDALVAASGNVFLQNIVDVSNALLVVTLAFKDPEGEYVVTYSVPGGITVVIADTAAGGVSIPFGRFLTMVGTSQDEMALPSGAVAGDIRCVSGRSLSVINQGSTDFDDVDAYPPGRDMAVQADGLVAMRNNGSVAANRGDAVYCVVNTAGGDELGEARSDADGGNTVLLDKKQAYWAMPVEPGAVGWVKADLA